MANKMSEKKKNSGQSEMEESKAQASEKEPKSARASAREERAAREERQSKPVKRDARPSQASSKKSGGWRNWGPVRFTRESYRELRYKVTWPTFVEARNMTLVVIVLSAVVGLLLGLLDLGLLQAFKAITGK